MFAEQSSHNLGVNQTQVFVRRLLPAICMQKPSCLLLAWQGPLRCNRVEASGGAVPCPCLNAIGAGGVRDSLRGELTHTHTHMHNGQWSGDREVGGGETEQIDRQTRRDADRGRTRRLVFCRETCANIYKAARFCSAL